MRKVKLGFTLIEVSLFLAVTALLFFGVTLGVRSSIFQQRYNDSVQNYADFLRSVYSETTNVEHIGTGTSEHAVYGKLVTFGETYDLNGNALINDESKIYEYTVIGDIGEIGGGTSANGLLNLINAMKTLNVNVLVDGDGGFSFAGIVKEYIPRWQAEIQNVSGNSFKGSILVVRHPRSGNVQTLVSDTTVEVNQILKTGNTESKTKLLTDRLNNFSFKDVDFCVNPTGEIGGQRRDIRLSSNAHNASSIDIVDQESDNNRCNG